VRVGIAGHARCPECGAEGFDGILVVHGTTRLAGAGGLTSIVLLSIYGSLLGFAIARDATRMGARWSPLASLGELVLLALVGMVVLALALRQRRRGRDVALGRTTRPGAVVWNVHPRGIEVREGSRRTWIPRAEVGRIDCIDSFIGEVSQLLLILRRSTWRGAIGTTRVLYVRGSKDERRSVWRSVRKTLALPE